MKSQKEAKKLGRMTVVAPQGSTALAAQSSKSFAQASQRKALTASQVDESARCGLFARARITIRETVMARLVALPLVEKNSWSAELRTRAPAHGTENPRWGQKTRPVVPLVVELLSPISATRAGGGYRCENLWRIVGRRARVVEILSRCFKALSNHVDALGSLYHA